MKKILVIVMALLMVLALAGCGEQTAAGGENNSTDIVTDLEFADVSDPLYITQLEYAMGETVDNAYYKRTANDSGESTYMVVRENDGEYVYLPVTETVVYTTGEEVAYYKEVYMTYKINGTEMEKTQYQLYVPASSGEPITMSGGLPADAARTVEV